MDAQVLSILANIAQIVGIVWVLFLGARTIPEIINRKDTQQQRNTSSSTRRPHYRSNNLDGGERNTIIWFITGVFIFSVSSVIWVAIRSTSPVRELLWYEAAIVGLIASSLIAGMISIIHYKYGGSYPTFTHIPSIILGSLIAIMIKLLLNPLHWHLIGVAILCFLGAFGGTFAFILVLRLAREFNW